MRGNNGRSNSGLVGNRGGNVPGGVGGGDYRNGDVLAGAAIDPAAYALAYQVSQAIDERLTTGRGHYYSRAGELLHTLDEVVRAMLEGELA